MLLILAQYLQTLETAFNVFQYLTLRSILSALTALAVSLLVGPWMIRRLSHYQIGQQIRDDGPTVAFDQGRNTDHGWRADIGRSCFVRPCFGPT